MKTKTPALADAIACIEQIKAEYYTDDMKCEAMHVRVAILSLKNALVAENVS